MKSRVMRDTGKHSGKSVVFVSSNVKTEFYLVTDNGVEVIDFLEAVKHLKAKPEEVGAPSDSAPYHYTHVQKALDEFDKEYVVAAAVPVSAKRTDLDRTSLEANSFLRTVMQITTDSVLKSKCDILMGYINEGIYARLPKEIKALSREYKGDRVRMKKEEYKILQFIEGCTSTYHTTIREQHNDILNATSPQIVISETFI